MLKEGQCSIVGTTWIEHGDTSSDTRSRHLALERGGSHEKDNGSHPELNRSLSIKR